MFNKKRKAKKTVTKRKNKVRRKGNNRKFSKQFPSIAALKIPEIVPSAVLNELQEDAQNHNGVIQEIDQGYPVIVLDEDTLEVSQLSPKVKTPDLGQLSASIRKDIITSATLGSDKQNGRLVMVPNDKTIAALDEFDQLRNGNKFQWAIFPGQISDDDLDAHVTLLDNKVSLTTLKELANQPTSLHVDNNELIEGPVTNQSVPTDQPDETTKADGSDDDDDVDMDQVLANDGSQANNSPLPDNQSTPVNDETPSSANPEPPSSAEINADALSQAIATGNNDLWDQVFNEADDNDADSDDTDDNEDTSQDTTNDTPMSPMNADEYQDQVATIQKQQLYDNDLHLTIDNAAFDAAFAGTKPKSISGITSQAPVTDELKDAVNTLTQEANHQLQQLYDTHQQQLVAEYTARVQDAVASIGNQLKMHGTGPLSDARDDLDAQYRQSMDSLDEMTQDATKQLDEQYTKRREEAAQAAALAAKQAFDEMHHDDLVRQKQNVKQDLHEKIITKRTTGLNELQKTRVDVATNTFRDVHSEILGQMKDLYNQMEHDEDELASLYDDKLESTVLNRYDTDTRRQQQLSAALEHDQTIQELQTQTAQLKEQHREEIEKTKKYMEQQLADFQTKSNQERKQLQANADARYDDAQADVKAAHNQIDNLNAQIAEKVKSYENELTNRDSKYQKLLDKAADDKDKAELRREKDVASAHRNTLLTASLGIVTALLIGCLSGFFLFGNHGQSQQSQQPSTTIVTTPQHNSKK